MRYQAAVIARLFRRNVERWGEVLRRSAPTVEIAPVVLRRVRLTISSAPTVIVTPRVRQ
jgi:hypothetical protein